MNMKKPKPEIRETDERLDELEEFNSDELMPLPQRLKGKRKPPESPVEAQDEAERPLEQSGVVEPDLQEIKARKIAHQVSLRR